MPDPVPPPQPLWKRLAWMGAIWLASVSALGLVAWALRLWLERSA